MKRLSAIEKSVLLLASLFIILGALDMVHPTARFVLHPTDVSYRGARLGQTSSPEHVTKEGARLYGVLSVVIGSLIVAVIFYRPRR
jgi:hypothetical protein